MTEDTLDYLRSLHTHAVDARHGYEEALEQAEGKGLSPVFRDMIALHQTNAGELASESARLGQTSEDEGSFMSTVHRAIMDVRGLFGGLDESVLPGLIDGETRNVSAYAEALKLPDMAAATRDLLTRQKQRIEQAIQTMKTLAPG